MRWDGYVKQFKATQTCKISGTKTRRNKKHWRRRKKNTKRYSKEVLCKGEEWNKIAQNGGYWWDLPN
jgi:hypothetical protein